MKVKPLNIAIWMALASVIARVVMHAVQIEVQKIGLYSNFFNFFVLVIGIFFSIRQYKIITPDNTSYKDDVKNGMKAGALYALIMAIFFYVFYKFIDTEYFSRLTQLKLEEAAVERNYTKEDVEKVLENARKVYTPFFVMTVNLILYLIMSTLYSLALAFAMRKFPGFQK